LEKDDDDYSQDGLGVSGIRGSRLPPSFFIFVFFLLLLLVLVLDSG